MAFSWNEDAKGKSGTEGWKEVKVRRKYKSIDPVQGEQGLSVLKNHLQEEEFGQQEPQHLENSGFRELGFQGREFLGNVPKRKP